MDNNNFLNVLDLESNLCIDEQSIGNFIGVSDQAEKCWKLAIYLGNEKLCIFFESEKGIVSEKLFKELVSIAGTQSITRNHLLELADSSSDTIVYTEYFGDKQQFEFFIYKLNLIRTPNQNRIKAYDFLKTLEFNLSQINLLEEGDIVGFVRPGYHHVAILTDKSRMIVTHRYGEPEDGGRPLTVSGSLFGLPMDKAVVCEDHCIEVAGHRKMAKSNESYDKLHIPRSKREIVQEAKRRIGEKGYSVSKRNCQHFASECRNGTSYSSEVQGVVDGFKYTALLGFVGLGAVAIATRFFGSNDSRSYTSGNMRPIEENREKRVQIEKP